MQDLELGELFGSNSSQDTVNLIIKKADLIGLIPSLVNRAEELFVALLLTALSNFQGEIATENAEILTDENNESIRYDNSEDFFTRVNYWRKIYTESNNQEYLQFQLVTFVYQLYEAD